MNPKYQNNIQDILNNDKQLTRKEAKLLEMILPGASNSKTLDLFVSETKFYTQAKVCRKLGFHPITLYRAKSIGALCPREISQGIHRYFASDIEEAILQGSTQSMAGSVLIRIHKTTLFPVLAA